MLTYNSVAEIYASMEKARERLRHTLEGLADEQENFREAPDRWTIAEIVEHLSIVEGQVSKVVEKVVGKAEAEGAPAADGRAPLVELGEVAERAQREKFQAPEFALPSGSVKLAESISRLDGARSALVSLRPRIEALDLTAYRFPHPVFGPLDPYHWLAVIGLHEERHRRQIEGLIAAAEANGSGGDKAADAS
jgi:hypothetical protein